MQRSKYVIVTRLGAEDPALLVHSYTGSMDIVGPTLANWFVDKNATVDQLSEKVVSQLKNRGYLWSDEEDEKKVFSIISYDLHLKQIEKSTNTFWVIPTYQCNLRCYYCFQSHKLHAGEGLGKTIMSPKMVEDLFTIFRELGGAGPRAKEGKGRYITLFGGEPLMEQTRECVESIVHHAKLEQYRIGAITNGINLNHFSDLLGPDKIRWIQITLDGLGALNDKRRTPGKTEGFSRIVENISLALARGAQVSLRTNTDKTLITKMAELENYAVEKGWTKHPGFSWYMTPVEAHVNQSSGKFTVSSVDIIKETLSTGSNVIKPPYLNKFNHLFSSLQTETLNKLAEPSACGAHTKMYYFDPAGYIYSCAEQVGKPEFAVGNFENSHAQIDEEKLKMWMSRHVGNMPVCSGCQYSLFCGGGCANAARLASKDFMGPRCFGIQESFQFVAKEFLKNKIASLMNDRNKLSDYEIIHLNPDELIAKNRKNIKLSMEEVVSA